MQAGRIVIFSLLLLLTTSNSGWAQTCFESWNPQAKYVERIDTVIVSYSGMGSYLEAAIFEDVNKSFSQIPQIKVINDREKSRHLPDDTWKKHNVVFLRFTMSKRTEKGFLSDVVVAALSVNLSRYSEYDGVTENALSGHPYPFIASKNPKELGKTILEGVHKLTGSLAGNVNCANHYNDKLCRRDCPMDIAPQGKPPKQSKTPDEVNERMQQMKK